MKTNFLSPSLLNSCCKRLFVTLFFIFASGQSSLFAIQLSGIYFSACEREIGIILNVDDTNIKVLNLDGKIKSIKRFDIIYIAQYPVGKVNISKFEPDDSIKIVEIQTLYENQVADLLKGWMTNYSEKNISFFTTDGNETVIDINDIWNISFQEQAEPLFFNNNRTVKKFNFIHPYPFISCEVDTASSEGLKVYPHHLLGDPLLIKAELDRLQVGYQQLHTYVKEKVFYPVPQLYSNLTSLSFWGSYGLRHGASSTRNSSFLPALRSELSEGLYKFQRVMITGVAPMPYSIHEEPQSQFYYGMKSGYFHMSFMFDLNRFLIGDEKYHWQSDDLVNNEDRQNEKFHLGFGFDYGNYSVEYAMADVDFGVRHNEFFHSDTSALGRIGLFYTHRLAKASFYMGSGSGISDEEDEELVPGDGASEEEIAYIEYLNQKQRSKPDIDLHLKYYRINIDFTGFSELKPQYSIIYRYTKFTRGPNALNSGEFQYEGEGLTNVVYLNYELKEEDLFFSGFFSVEMTKNKSGTTEFTETSQNTYLKGGVSIGLVF